ncbi:MAG: hypothetical protein J7K30_16015 [Deltaproteobacteria bacterium]|nr:hypothetical protein [Deltaproteobacteria bacterium]
MKDAQNSIKKLLLKGFNPDEVANLLEVNASIVQDVVSLIKRDGLNS